MIEKDSIKWAVEFIGKHSDTDLFPKILEIEAIIDEIESFADTLSSSDLSQLKVGPCRRFLVPKDELSFRQATQLEPLDNIILAAIIYQYGSEIEKRRLGEDIVYSYRFSPSINEGFYSDKNAWNKFWESANRRSKQFEKIIYCDINDFYNQIYHHVIENQLIASHFPNQVIKWILKLLESTTVGVSRGVPVGPHPIHLIAEASMIPIDNSLMQQGINFIRFVDDIIIFCETDKKAKNNLLTISNVLDKQQRLNLQRNKTKIFDKEEFEIYCNSMVEDRPISEDEDEVLNIIRKYSGGNPYLTISYNDISKSDWESISYEIVEQIIYEYIEQEKPDYIRLRWFYRRLAQIGHPGAIEVSLKEISNLAPCFSNICMYLGSIQSIDENKWKEIGDNLIKLLNLDEVEDNQYFRLMIVSLFTKNKHINHFSTLAQKYSNIDSIIKREIILSAKENSAFDWLREQKESFQNMDHWQKIAYIYAVSGLPNDERKYLINSIDINNPFEKSLALWSKKQII